MIEQTLRQLAAAGAPSITASPFLAERVLALHHRSVRRRRRVGASLALVGLVAGGTVAARSEGQSRFYGIYTPSGSMAPTVSQEETLMADRTLTPERD